MLGRIVKTIHILHYLHDPKRRNRIQLPLNRGEARHALAQKIRFVDDGVLRSGDIDEIMDKVSALSVLPNAVLVWNRERIAGIASSIEMSSGKPVPPDELARVSPFQRARLLVSGRYNFEKLTVPE